MTAKGMVMIQNKVVNTFKRLEYVASLLYTWTIWVIVEADGVMEARYTMSSKVLPSGINSYTWLTHIISSKIVGQITSLMAEKRYSFAFFRLARIGESAISIPVTIMLRGASIFPMSFIGARMTAGSFILQKIAGDLLLWLIHLYWILSFPFQVWLFGEHCAAVCPEKYQLYRHKCAWIQYIVGTQNSTYKWDNHISRVGIHDSCTFNRGPVPKFSSYIYKIKAEHV